MWQRIALLIAACSFAMPATASVYVIDFKPTAAQHSEFDRGVEAIDDYNQASTVRLVEVEGGDKKSASFLVIAMNTGSRSFVLGPENIKVRLSDGQLIPLITYEQATAAERKKQKRERIWQILGDAATYHSVDGTSSGEGTYSGSGGSGSFSFAATDPGAELAAKREAELVIDRNHANLEAQRSVRAVSRNSLLRDTTVDPNAIYGGIAKLSVTDTIRKTLGSTPLIVEVTVQGEQHTFVGQLVAIK